MDFTILKLTTNYHTLEVVHEEKDLGIIIDDTLRFHQQTACVVKKANQVLAVIKRSFNTRDEITITTLFKSMVRPHLEYANAIWGPHFQADIIKVESVQRRATKMIYGLTNLPYQVKTLKLPSLVYRRRRGNMIQIFKILNDSLRIDKNQFFKIREGSRTRGHRNKIFKEHAIRVPRRNNLPQKSANDWNLLPEKVVNSPSVNIFKNRLDKYWLEHHYDIPN